MLIFDVSAIEIDYPSSRPNGYEQGKVDEECESESSVQILSDSPQHPKTRDTSFSQCRGRCGFRFLGLDDEVHFLLVGLHLQMKIICE